MDSNTQQDNTSTKVPRFPTTFDILLSSTPSTTTTLHLSSPPLLTASLHTTWYGKSHLTLHASASLSSPVLATARNASLASTNSTITITLPDAAPLTEPLRFEPHITGGASYSFVAPAEAGLPEKFQWRPSCGEDVRADDALAEGWKLVRLDDEEVLAVLIDCPGMHGGMGRFRFLGRAAEEEGLGETWTVMAVVTALRIWQMRWFIGSGGGGAAAVGGSVSRT